MSSENCKVVNCLVKKQNTLSKKVLKLEKKNYIKGIICEQKIRVASWNILKFDNFSENGWTYDIINNTFTPSVNGNYLISIRLAVKNFQDNNGIPSMTPGNEEFGVRFCQNDSVIPCSYVSIPVPPSRIFGPFIQNGILTTSTFIAENIKAGCPIKIEIQDFGNPSDPEYLTIIKSVNNESVLSIIKI